MTDDPKAWDGWLRLKGGVEIAGLWVEKKDHDLKIERLTRDRDQATVLVGELAALIPIKETIEATRTGATMIKWFKDHLRDAT